MLWLLALLACEPRTKGPAAAETDWVQALQVAPGTQIPAVLEVSFETPEPTSAWIEFGVDAPGARRTLISPAAQQHTIPVFGLGALQAVSMQVVVQASDGTEHRSGVFTETSGGLLPGSPTFDITINSYDAPAEAVLLLSVYGEPGHLVMINLDGEVVWSRAYEEEDGEIGLGVLPTGDGLRYNRFQSELEDGRIGRMDLLGEIQEEAAAEDSHHFLTTTATGEVVWMREDPRPLAPYAAVIGDQIVVGPDAAQVLFSTWDALTFADEDVPTPVVSWTHANWIEHHPDRKTYLMSTAYTNVILELAEDGEVVRLFNGRDAVDGTYTYANPQDAFEFPHGPHWASNGDLLVFSTSSRVSRAIRYRIDDEAGTIEAVWEFGRSYGYEAKALGEVQELPDGNILISWGSVGILQIVDPTDDTVLWEAQAPLQQFTTQVHYLETPYSTL